MKQKSVDVYFYVNNKQQPELIGNMANTIAKLAGVKKASISPRVKQLLAVEYDPNQLSGNTLVKFVKQSGYPAAMVGM